MPKHKKVKVRVILEEVMKGDRWGWSTKRPGRFTPGKETRYSLYRRLGGSHGRSGQVPKISPPNGKPRKTSPSTRSWYKHTMGERVTPTNTVHRYEQDVERPCRQRTIKPGLLIILSLLLLLYELHNEELNDLYSSPSIARVIKWRRMR